MFLPVYEKELENVAGGHVGPGLPNNGNGPLPPPDNQNNSLPKGAKIGLITAASVVGAGGLYGIYKIARVLSRA
jgi:hypothetical protein